MVDHMDITMQYVEAADSWANRDAHIDRETRDRFIDYNLHLASVHSNLAVAQRLGEIGDILETKVYPAIAERV